MEKESAIVAKSCATRALPVACRRPLWVWCLGLFGLAAYTAERRTKEISICKALGASIGGITTLLSRDFLQLVALSCLVGNE